VTSPTPSPTVPTPVPGGPPAPRVAIYLLLPHDEEKAKALIVVVEEFANAKGQRAVRFYDRPEDHAPRPRLKALLARTRTGRFDIVAVAAVGALARSHPGALRIVRELDAFGVKVVSVGEPWFDVHDPALEWISEGESRLLARSANAVEAKRRRGERVGALPYGFHCPGGRNIEPNPDEQRVIAEACRLRDEGRSYRQIAQALTAGGCRSRRGTDLSHQQVARMVRRRLAS
jgi:DNA invertase Pin-like site-specific DNA recombinase